MDTSPLTLCPKRTAIEGADDWASCGLFPEGQPSYPPPRVHRTACAHCLSGEAARRQVFADLKQHYDLMGHYYGEPKPDHAGLLAAQFPAPAERVAPAKPLEWISIVLTAPRGADYLPETCESIEAAGFPRPLIFAEPGSKIPADRAADATTWARLHGPYQNSTAALASIRLAMATRGFDAALICEDDVALAHGLRAYLDAALWPCDPVRLGWIALFLNENNAAGVPGWIRFDGRSLYGAQCLVLSRAALEQYIFSAFHLTHREAQRQHPNAEAFQDMEISRWANANRRPSFIVRGRGGQSLVAHRGTVSALFPWGLDASRKEQTLAGIDAGDAAILRRGCC